MASERKFVAENVRRVLLKEYLMKEVSRAGFGGLDVQRTPMGTRVLLTTERPGLVIGRRGQTIKNLTTAIEERFEVKVEKVWVRIQKDGKHAIIKLAEECGVKIAIENCPMLFGADQWPGGQNLMCTPVIYKKLFEIIPSPNFGLNFDPSHYVWQGLDYLKTVYDFSDRIFHIHFKDIKLYPEKLKECGVLAYPLDYMSPKIPGLGDVNWGAFISALNDIRFNGCAVIEVEDKAFEGSREDILNSIRLSKRYLDNYLI